MEVWTTAHLRAGLRHRPFFDFIERRAKSGSNDKGDIGGIRTIDGKRVVVEVKNTALVKVGPWLNEAEVERVNDDAAASFVVYKRTGFGRTQMGKQVVLMTLDDVIVLLGGDRPTVGQEENEGE